jgi:hypothetical protein
MPMVECDHIHVFAHNRHHHHLEVGRMLVASVFRDLKLVFQEFVASGFLDRELVFSLDKTCFVLYANVGSQNNGYWCSITHHAGHEVASYVIKVRVWCAVSS